jgi:hypothetical protein
MNDTNIRDVVKEKYGQAALRVHSGGSSCCGASAALAVRGESNLEKCGLCNMK